MPALPNVYESDVDFASLALGYPDFAKKSAPYILLRERCSRNGRLKANRQLDFSDPESVR